jgi:cytochrome c peroxidase
VLGNNTSRFVFPLGAEWLERPRDVLGGTGADASHAARESIVRGHDVFMFRTFFIRDSMHLNSVGLGNPVKRTCSTCHGMHMTGMDVANGWMDIGTTNLPWAREAPQNPWTTEKPELPLFKVTCRADLPPHPFLGRVIYTQDPGRALISGKCNDVGAIVMQQFRGLAARAPYFANGSAATLRELVDFYDRRYDIGYSEQEKQDLVAFLRVL